MILPQCFLYLLVLLFVSPLLSGQSLFDSENVNTRFSVGVNLPPKFLPGGDMDGFSLPEDTPVGTMVSNILTFHEKYLLYYLIVYFFFYNKVYRLRGEDPEGSRVAYSISGDFLSVVRNTGAVTLVKPLDHETNSEIEVIITLTGIKLNIFTTKVIGN